MQTPDHRVALDRLVAAAGDGRLEAVARHHGLQVVVAFGSAIRAEVTAPGDLDLAFLPGTDRHVDPIALASDFHVLAQPAEIDLMDLSRAGVVAREQALLGEPLYEDVRGRYVLARDRAVKERMETRWLRILDLDLLSG